MTSLTTLIFASYWAAALLAFSKIRVVSSTSFSIFIFLSDMFANLDFNSFLVASCPTRIIFNFCSRFSSFSFCSNNDLIVVEFCCILFVTSPLSWSVFERESFASWREFLIFFILSSTLSLFVAAWDCCFNTWLVSESIKASSAFAVFLVSLTEFIESFSCWIVTSSCDLFSCKLFNSDSISGRRKSIWFNRLVFVAILLFADSDWSMAVLSSESIAAFATWYASASSMNFCFSSSSFFISSFNWLRCSSNFFVSDWIAFKFRSFEIFWDSMSFNLLEACIACNLLSSSSKRSYRSW